VGGVRQQFSTRENILLSRFSVEFFRKAHKLLEVRGEMPDLGFQERGYLFLATSEGQAVLRKNVETQTSMGADIALMEPSDLASRFPWLEVSDLSLGSLGRSGEGWLDPYSLLQALKAKAREQGVLYLSDEVVGLPVREGRIRHVELRDGGPMEADTIVNAAGPMAASLATMAGTDLPVRPRRRYVYRIQADPVARHFPMVIDPSGVYVRPEGDGYLCGVSPPAEDDPDTTDLTMAYDLFHYVVWPTLAHRIPSFDALRLGSSWAGLYAYNTLDQNAVLGPHPTVPNLIFANGFSGHGLQHAPGIGRGIADWILHGGYRSLDLTRFSFERIAGGRPIREENVV
jgi:sarcosine oxidase